MSLSKLRVYALVPAYNEADRIGTTVESLRSRPEIEHIVVVDDGSSDDTARRAEDAGAHTVIRQANAGKGAALSAAYRAARDEADVFLLLDADLGASASEASKLLPPITRGEAEMVVGMLPPDPAFAATGQSGGSGRVVRLANEGIRRATGHTFKQPLCGQRAVKRDVLEAILAKRGEADLFGNGFGVEAVLTIDTLLAGFRIVEVETFFRHKVTGADWRGLLHRARQYADVARTVAQYR